MTIDTGMLKVDTGFSVRADDDLELDTISAPSHMSRFTTERTDLVVPPVGTCSDLDASVELVATAQEVSTQLSDILSLVIVQTDDKQGRLNDCQTVCVVTVRVLELGS